MSKSIKLTTLITSFLLLFTIWFAFVPMFTVYNIGGEIASGTAPNYNTNNEDTSKIISDSLPEEYTSQDGMTYYNFVVPDNAQHEMKVSLVLEEGSQELNPYTPSGLFTPFQLLVRIIKDKNKETPYKIQRIELF